ncbi:hypothetical protein DAPPUDRAFT_97675 [Daphnia pulex]|uniref:Uncharacterized protein n=1 Tax=Daphnia pulex TaxID=6669 RepID=E9G1Z7_DAPPU|nr:uncharacterized protein LOC124320440 [Daphnia pulicaria]EFX86577.1 hypothetical protein DAPPUDRAFT_97675 [Daphnia pulex]|eukprot:EFX86577.1 hypothetical protein DAPPUDRAFT_97675 [Daphnia pulex]
MELIKIIFVLASGWATLAIAGNTDQDMFWAARGKKASIEGNWPDSVVMEPFVAAVYDKRDGTFWAARGKKYAADGGDGVPFWATRGKKGDLEIPFWAARGKRIPQSEMNETEEEGNRREKRSAGRDTSIIHSGQRFRNRPARPASQAAEPFWAARGKKNSNVSKFPLL